MKTKFETDNIFPVSKSGVLLFSKACLTQFLNRWPLFTIGLEPIIALLWRLLFIDHCITWL